MARYTFVKHARKDYPEHGIKKGEGYYWWSFRFGGVYYSKTMPKPSQLTQSDYLSRGMEIEERLGTLSAEMSIEDLQAERDSMVEDIRQLGEEQTEKLDNMPEGLQQGDVGQLLEARADNCESWASDLEGVDIEELAEEDVELLEELEEEEEDEKTDEELLEDREEAENQTEEEKQEAEKKLKLEKEEKEQRRVECIEEAQYEHRQGIVDELRGCTFPGD